MCKINIDLSENEMGIIKRRFLPTNLTQLNLSKTYLHFDSQYYKYT